MLESVDDIEAVIRDEYKSGDTIPQLYKPGDTIPQLYKPGDTISRLALRPDGGQPRRGNNMSNTLRGCEMVV